ncbi:DUF3800 domain-containing protein [Leifsonia shinshuensis]
MLIAYLDEFGHVGPYVSPQHKKFFHNPIFGYAGIVVPTTSVRAFGAKFERSKEREFRAEIHESGKHPRRWEKKGSEIFTTGSHVRYPQRVDLIDDLADYLVRRGGRIFFSGEVKPVGSPAESGQTAAVTTRKALTEAVRRLCEYADARDEELLVLLDEGGPLPREEAITAMAQFIYSSSAPHMKRVLEVPMQLESHRYGAVQFADWICAALTRAVHFHFTPSAEFSWAPNVIAQLVVNRSTSQSQIWVPTTRDRVKDVGLAHARKWANRPSTSERVVRSPRLTLRVRDAVG